MNTYKNFVKYFTTGMISSVAFFSNNMSSNDYNTQKIKENALVLIPIYLIPFAIIWGLFYIYLDHSVPAIIPFSYSLISLLNLWSFKKTKNIALFQNIQTTLILLFPFFLMWVLGGFALGSFVFIWAFFAPISALIYNSKNEALYWFYAFIALIVFSTIIDESLLSSHTTFMPQIAVEMFFLLNITLGLSGIYFLIRYYINENERSTHEALKKEHIELQKRSQELHEANKKLEYHANHDSLTALPNRYYLREHLGHKLAHAKRNKYSVALLFMDLDGFKGVNDNLGHATGDQVLKDVSFRLKSLLREEDEISRLGGDEFAIVIGDLKDISYVEMIAKRIIDEINRDYDYLPNSSQIGVSIGISLFPKNADDIDTLINNADKAMYEVKQASKNAYLFYNKAMHSSS
ncbi:MAG: GGDEF domain-containing protein [Sulfurimonas sp.]|uniref:GGDEF domain-containing protein n=1 Tax=Sulfurimonas sp. TaxID=2022749 RepID=UPI0026023A8A|nr:GGDEF domain-containing protein [Sulfurimonas sp.]MCW8896258.1 GGDEF domain-containing protein [Sulfurimonas sp.]MCW8953575.1 GGDEF domain-containing protein [Sulfurimonas sp.]MCW9067378.1 GGDEF domain-containing protein [Sulfurimonas sp.]